MTGPGSQKLVEDLRRENAALKEIVVQAEKALQASIYEATHLSPVEDDGSHWCRISAGTLTKLRAARLAIWDQIGPWA